MNTRRGFFEEEEMDLEDEGMGVNEKLLLSVLLFGLLIGVFLGLLLDVVAGKGCEGDGEWVDGEVLEEVCPFVGKLLLDFSFSEINNFVLCI